MKIRRMQVVLIAFAVASWLGAVLELGAAAGSSGDECIEHAANCGDAYLQEHRK